MLNRIKNIEANFSISKAAFIIGFFTLLTKFLAIYRERLFASTFGQNQILDSYFAAFRIPDFVTNLFILNTLAVAFIPVYTEILTKDKKKTDEIAASILNLVLLGISGICLILFLFSGYLTQKLVPGFNQEYYSYTLNLTRLFLLSPVIFAASTIFGGILNAQKKFLVASIAPIFYNLGIIFGVIFLYPRFGVMGLGYGVVLGAIVQMLIQWISTSQIGFSIKPILNFKDNYVVRIWKLYVPRIFTFDLANVTLLLGTMIGSKLIAGSISALNQAYNLESVPVSIFAYSLALASFPVLSEFFALKNDRAFTKSISQTIQQVLFFIIPISILMLLMRAYIVRLILGAGNFNWEDTIRTFNVLGIFSFSLFSQSLTTVLSRAFYARQNTKVPVYINLFAIFLNIIFSVILGYKYGVAGITAAFVISSIVSAILLFIVLRHHLKDSLGEENIETLKEFDQNLSSSVTKIIISSIVMGLVSYASIYFLAPFVDTRTVVGILIQSGLASIFGGICYMLTGKLLKLTEAKYMLDFFRKLLYI